MKIVEQRCGWRSRKRNAVSTTNFHSMPWLDIFADIVAHRVGCRHGPLRYRRHRFAPEIIQHAIWLYLPSP
jgi:hypothetical protein